MTSLLTQAFPNSQATASTKKSSRSAVGPRQPGRSGIPQKQFTEPSSKVRQPLGVLNNSTTLRSTSLKHPSKVTHDNTQTKPVRKAGTVSSSSKVPRIKRSSTTSVSKKAVLDDLPDIENFPSINSTDDPSPFVPPSYFKTLTDSLKCTTVVPSPINGDFLNMRSLSSVTLELQQRPTTMELEGPLMDYSVLSDAPSMDLTNNDITLTPVELPTIPDFD